jgi:tetratricopeptide (TPR) repeat protein
MKRFSWGCLWGALAAGLLLWVGGCAHKPPSAKEQVKEALDLYYLGEKARQAGNLEGAVNAYRRSLAISPRPIVHLHLAHVLIDLGRFDEAGTHLDRALANNPQYTLAQEERQRLEAKITVAQRTGTPVVEAKPLEPFPPPAPEKQIPASGKEEAPATPVAEGAERPAPPGPPVSPEQQQQVDSLLAQARKALDEGRTQDAIAAYRSCMEVAPNRGDLHYYLGNIYLTSGDIERAYLEYSHALDLNPNQPGAYNNLGVVYEYKGRTEEAIAAYRDAIRVGDHTDAYYNLAVLMEKRGQWEEALALYRIYVGRDSSSSWAEKARNQIRSLERALY